MRCGPPAGLLSLSLKLNLPVESTLVVAAISMPLVRLIRMTSSPAAGLLVVTLVTVPERVWAWAGARDDAIMRAISRDDLGRLVKRTPWKNYSAFSVLYESKALSPVRIFLVQKRVA